MKKFSVLFNQSKNSLLISIVENGNIILDELSNEANGIETYEYVGLVFNSIGKLDKKKPIQIFFNLKNTPFIFILLVLKIQVSTDSKIQIFLKDNETYDFIQEFLDADPEETKGFFTNDSAGIKNNNYANSLDNDSTDSEEDVKDCDIKMREKFQNIKKELDKHQEIIKRKGFLEDVDINDLDPELRQENEKIERYLEIIKNASNDNFVDTMENNFVNELRRINIELF